jgi:hypothetical protein
MAELNAVLRALTQAPSGAYEDTPSEVALEAPSRLRFQLVGSGTMAILFVGRASGSQPAPHKRPSGPPGQAVSAKSCRDHFRNSQLRKQRRRQGCAGYKKRPVTARMVGQADASLARVSAAVSGETSPNRLKLLDCVGVSPADYTGGGR